MKLYAKELVKAEKEIKSLQEELEVYEDEAADYADTIRQKDKEITALRDELDKTVRDYENLVHTYAAVKVAGMEALEDKTEWKRRAYRMYVHLDCHRAHEYDSWEYPWYAFIDKHPEAAEWFEEE